MKKRLFLMILIVLLSGESLLQAQHYFSHYVAAKREIPVKGVSNGSKGDLVMRSIPLQYVRVFISDKTISVLFLEPTEDVLLIVRNMDTGQVIYSESYDSPENVDLPLDTESGNFQISIASGELELQGDFSF